MQEQLPTVKSSQGSPQAHAIRTRAPSAQELCEFLFTPTLTEACAVTYAHNFTGVKVQLQHCRLDWICSGFLVQDIWNPAGNYRTLCIWPTGKQGFWTALSQSAHWLTLGQNIICLWRRPRSRPSEHSCQSWTWTVKETQMTNCFREIRSHGVLLNSTITARQGCKMELKKKQMYLGQLIL